MLHAMFIYAHAACGAAAFVFGLVGLRPRAKGVPTMFRPYLGALWLMVVFLIVVVGIDWMNLGPIDRSVYGALTLLALYTGWRGWRALRNLQSRATGWKGNYIDDVGFTLIALFDGFVIISALDLGAPTWLIAIIGILGILVGLVVGLYGLFLGIVGIREVHSTTTGRAALVVLIPIAVIFLLVLLLGVTLVALFFGSQQQFR